MAVVPEDTGYPMNWFKNKKSVRDMFECAVCLEVIKDPVQVRDCGHQFCRYCMDRVLGGLQVECPSCRKKNSGEMVFTDNAANRTIGKLEVNCPSSQCEWDGSLNSLLEEHTANCPFFLLNCSHVGCDIQVTRQEIQEHLTQCEKRMIICEHCKSEHVFKEKDEHLATCPLLPVECTNQCSEKIILRNEMGEHLATVCPKTIICCKYLEFGCEHECEREKMKEHLSQAVEEHLDLSISRLKEKHENDLNEIQSKHERDLKELKQEITDVLKLNCSGTFELEISNFAERLSQAKSFSSLSNQIFGEPFFTSHGYKMRLEIRLDQKSCGFAGHMGAYVSLQKSDHDGILSWPFKKLCFLSVIDQQDDESCRKDHVVKLVPEGEDELKRPQQGGNIGFGCKTLISHFSLRIGNYIKNDTVYVRVQVLA